MCRTNHLKGGFHVMEHSSEKKVPASHFTSQKKKKKPHSQTDNMEIIRLWKDQILLTHFLRLTSLVISPGSRARWGRNIRWWGEKINAAPVCKAHEKARCHTRCCSCLKKITFSPPFPDVLTLQRNQNSVVIRLWLHCVCLFEKRRDLSQDVPHVFATAVRLFVKLCIFFLNFAHQWWSADDYSAFFLWL